MLNYTIRPMAAGDMEGFNALRRMPGVMENTLGLPSERVERNVEGYQHMGSDDHIFAAVLEDGTLIGTAGLNVHPNPRMRHGATLGILVHTGYQNQGVGTALMKTPLDRADHGLTLVRVELEVFDHDIAKKALLGPAPLAARFAAQVRESCPNFGLMADLSHFPMTYETSAQVIPVLRPYLTHFHIGNTVCQDPAAEAYGDEHPRFGFPNSSNDVPQVLDFLRQLRANGFFCPERPYILTFEIKPWVAEDADIVIANAKRTLNRAWALLED